MPTLVAFNAREYLSRRHDIMPTQLDLESYRERWAAQVTDEATGRGISVEIQQLDTGHEHPQMTPAAHQLIDAACRTTPVPEDVDTVVRREVPQLLEQLPQGWAWQERTDTDYPEWIITAPHGGLLFAAVDDISWETIVVSGHDDDISVSAHHTDLQPLMPTIQSAVDPRTATPETMATVTTIEDGILDPHLDHERPVVLQFLTPAGEPQHHLGQAHSSAPRSTASADAMAMLAKLRDITPATDTAPPATSTEPPATPPAPSTAETGPEI